MSITASALKMLTPNQKALHSFSSTLGPYRRRTRAETGMSNWNLMSLNGKAVSDVAIVICTHNRPLLLERCLKALSAMTLDKVSICVADSAPTSPEAAHIARRYGTTYVSHPLKGLSRARNIGTRATTAGIVGYVDDDMIPHPNWLASLVEAFSERNVMAATGPDLDIGLVEAPMAQLQEAVALSVLGAEPFCLNRSMPHWFERANFGGIGNGNFALRRTAFDHIGGFDERLGRGVPISGGEEHYAFFKIINAGFTIAYVPGAIVFHPPRPLSSAAQAKNTEDAISYMLFLAWNHPNHFWRVIKYVCEACAGKQRSWRRLPASSSVPLTGGGGRFSSALKGLSAFARSLTPTPK